MRVTSVSGLQDLAITQQGVGALTASFVMRRGQRTEVDLCQVNAEADRVLARRVSVHAGRPIVSYQRGATRSRRSTECVPTRASTPTLNLACNPAAGADRHETFYVTLTISSNAGQTATLDAPCG